jgi:hypothetical protein
MDKESHLLEELLINMLISLLTNLLTSSNDSNHDFPLFTIYQSCLTRPT